MSTLLVLTLAWGALSFGAVYPWAYAPLAAAAAVIGLYGLIRRPQAVALAHGRSLEIGILLVAAAMAAQLVPLPRAILLAISPGTDGLLQRYEIGYMALIAKVPDPWSVWHPLSVCPESTRVTLALFVSFGLLVLGCARGFSAKDVRSFLPRLVILGVALAFIALGHRWVSNGKVYGFWAPKLGQIYGIHGGGPFINPNHLAGWMLMTLPLALGYLAALAERGMEGSRFGWRNRLLWFSSPAGLRLVLVGSSIPIMALALVQTLSRSGLGGFVAAILLAGIVVGRSRLRWPRRVLLVLCLALLVVATMGRAGFDVIESRLDTAAVSFEGRVVAWQDTMRMFRDVPLAGTGFGSYGEMMFFYQSTNPLERFAEAHNDYVQVLAEGGLLVVIPAFVLLVIFIAAVRRRYRDDTPDPATYWIRTGAVTGLVAIALQEAVEFSLQIPGNTVLFVTLMAIAAGRLPHRRGFRAPASRDAGA